MRQKIKDSKLTERERERETVRVCVCLECESQRGCGALMAWRETDTKRKTGSRGFGEKGLKSVETNQGSRWFQRPQ